MKKYFLLFAVLLCTGVYMPAQSSPNADENQLFVPREMKKAYDKGTRAKDGAPGSNYWQNRSTYDINAEFDPKTGLLTAKETVIYYNESPDSLDRIVVRLYQDVSIPNRVRDWVIPDNMLGKGVDLKSASYNGRRLNLASSGDNNETRRTGTNLFIELQSKMPPKTNAELTFEWSMNIRELPPFRMGYYDETSYFIAYWYPQIAVYDDIDGWDTYDYTGTHEFYTDFSDFNVEIKVPENFIIWATGVWKNPAEILNEPYLGRYQKALVSDEVINIIAPDDLAKKDFTKETGGYVYYKFQADNISDFAFAVSDHYLWDGSSLVVDKQTGRRSFVDAAYKAESQDFYGVVKIAKESIVYFSDTLPGVPYPFPKMTVFNGAGGMEFPMIVNDGSSKELAGTVHVTSHEIAHSYMPFYMGINERKHAWMDEGWANMLPMELHERLAPGYKSIAQNNNNYAAHAGSFTEMPPFLLSPNVAGSSYRDAAYYRPAAAYYFLRHTLGKEKFAKALQGYMKDWHGKHPTPHDFFASMNKYAGEDLSWYWKPWFFEACYPDLSVKEHVMKDGRTSFVVENLGGMPLPVKLSLVFKDKTEKIIEHNASVWNQADKFITINFEGNISEIDSVKLGSHEIPDIYPQNNTLKMNGISKK